MNHPLAQAEQYTQLLGLLKKAKPAQLFFHNFHKQKTVH